MKKRERAVTWIADMYHYTTIFLNELLCGVKKSKKPSAHTSISIIHVYRRENKQALHITYIEVKKIVREKKPEALPLLSGRAHQKSQ